MNAGSLTQTISTTTVATPANAARSRLRGSVTFARAYPNGRDERRRGRGGLWGTATIQSMVPSSPRLLVILLASSAVLSLHGQQGPVAAPPAITTPPLSPADEMKTFRLPPGYRVELVASEPMVEEPVLIDFDADGRLWVLEMRGYMQDLPATNETAPVGRVSRARGHATATAAWTRRRCSSTASSSRVRSRCSTTASLSPSPAHLWFARDTNGDLAPTRRTRSRTRTAAPTPTPSTTPTVCSGRSTTGCTRREGDIYLRYKGGKFEVRRRSHAGSGARRRTTPAGSIAIRTSRCCTSTSCRRRTTRAIRTWRAPAALRVARAATPTRS